ncbi:MAG: hypothetical protein JWN04_2295 [Myxococcaceae bacterium]|nr:hypothetical protein [Myxococcaceae bacterium]
MGAAPSTGYITRVGLFYAVVMVLALALLVFAAGRARELCVLSVRAGRVLLMRGALPPSLLEAVLDIVSRARVERATVRVLRDGAAARLMASGLDEPTLQRLRNVLGTYPLPRLLAATAPKNKNLGQRLGLAWLGWWMNERR